MTNHGTEYCHLVMVRYDTILCGWLGSNLSEAWRSLNTVHEHSVLVMVFSEEWTVVSLMQPFRWSSAAALLRNLSGPMTFPRVKCKFSLVPAISGFPLAALSLVRPWTGQHHHHHHHHHLFLNREGRRDTTDNFATSFLHVPLFSTALWDLANSRLVNSLMLSSHLFLCLVFIPLSLYHYISTCNKTLKSKDFFGHPTFLFVCVSYQCTHPPSPTFFFLFFFLGGGGIIPKIEF